MAFRATNVLPSEALKDAKKLAVAIRRDSVRYSVQFAAQGGNADTLLGVLSGIGDTLNRLTTLAQTPGLGQYARDQENDQNYDVAAEFAAMMAALTAAGMAIAQAIPKQGGVLLTHTLDASGFRVPVEFSVAELAGVVTALDNLTAAIE